MNECRWHGTFTGESCPMCDEWNIEQTMEVNYGRSVDYDDERWFACGCCGEALLLNLEARVVAVCNVCGAHHAPVLTEEPGGIMYEYMPCMPQVDFDPRLGSVSGRGQ